MAKKQLRTQLTEIEKFYIAGNKSVPLDELCEKMPYLDPLAIAEYYNTVLLQSKQQQKADKPSDPETPKALDLMGKAPRGGVTILTQEANEFIESFKPLPPAKKENGRNCISKIK